MTTLPLGAVLKAALIAGLLAGLTVAVFHLAFTEPLIDRAITLEEQAHGHGEVADEPLVSRDTQRKGLVVGFTLYGLTWALIFGLAFQGAQRWLPAVSRFKQGLITAFLAYWAVGLLPFLKYPASPPGLGDPETIGFRQATYAGFLALSIVCVLLSVWLARRYGSRLAGHQNAWLPGLVLLALLSAVIFVAMPTSAEHAHVPADLLLNFRLMSIAGLTLFWGVMGVLFGKLMGSSRAVARA